MSLAALDRLEDAFDATTALLRPVDSAQWLRFAVVAFFVGGVGGASGVVQVSGGGGDPTDGVGALPGVVPPRLLGPGLPGVELVGVLAAVALVALAVLVTLAFLYVGSVMEFVLVAALERRRASLRDQFTTWRWPGSRLFGFRLALFAVVVLLVAGAAGLGLLLQGPGIRVLAVVLAVPVALLVVPLALLVDGLTTVFVVPVMYDERCGVLDGWRRLWPRLRAQPWETLAYVAVSVVLSAAGATAVATAVGVVAAVLVLPVGVLGVVVALATGNGLVTLVVLAPLVLAVALVVAALAAVLRVPILVYLRHYALFVLGDLGGPDLLAAVREVTGARPPGEHGEPREPA